MFYTSEHYSNLQKAVNRAVRNEGVVSSLEFDDLIAKVSKNRMQLKAGEVINLASLAERISEDLNAPITAQKLYDVMSSSFFRRMPGFFSEKSKKQIVENSSAHFENCLQQQYLDGRIPVDTREVFLEAWIIIRRDNKRIVALSSFVFEKASVFLSEDEQNEELKVLKNVVKQLEVGDFEALVRILGERAESRIVKVLVLEALKNLIITDRLPNLSGLSLAARQLILKILSGNCSLLVQKQDLFQAVHTCLSQEEKSCVQKLCTEELLQALPASSGSFFCHKEIALESWPQLIQTARSIVRCPLDYDSFLVAFYMRDLLQVASEFEEERRSLFSIGERIYHLLCAGTLEESNLCWLFEAAILLGEGKSLKEQIGILEELISRCVVEFKTKREKEVILKEIIKTQKILKFFCRGFSPCEQDRIVEKCMRVPLKVMEIIIERIAEKDRLDSLLLSQKVSRFEDKEEIDAFIEVFLNHWSDFRKYLPDFFQDLLASRQRGVFKTLQRIPVEGWFNLSQLKKRSTEHSRNFNELMISFGEMSLEEQEEFIEAQKMFVDEIFDESIADATSFQISYRPRKLRKEFARAISTAVSFSVDCSLELLDLIDSIVQWDGYLEIIRTMPEKQYNLFFKSLYRFDQKPLKNLELFQKIPSSDWGDCAVLWVGILEGDCGSDAEKKIIQILEEINPLDSKKMLDCLYELLEQDGLDQTRLLWALDRLTVMKSQDWRVFLKLMQFYLRIGFKGLCPFERAEQIALMLHEKREKLLDCVVLVQSGLPDSRISWNVVDRLSNWIDMPDLQERMQFLQHSIFPVLEGMNLSWSQFLLLEKFLTRETLEKIQAKFDFLKPYFRNLFSKTDGTLESKYICAGACIMTSMNIICGLSDILEPMDIQDLQALIVAQNLCIDKLPVSVRYNVIKKIIDIPSPRLRKDFVCLFFEVVEPDMKSSVVCSVVDCIRFFCKGDSAQALLVLEQDQKNKIFSYLRSGHSLVGFNLGSFLQGIPCNEWADLVDLLSQMHIREEIKRDFFSLLNDQDIYPSQCKKLLLSLMPILSTMKVRSDKFSRKFFEKIAELTSEGWATFVDLAAPFSNDLSFFSPMNESQMQECLIMRNLFVREGMSDRSICKLTEYCKDLLYAFVWSENRAQEEAISVEQLRLKMIALQEKLSFIAQDSEQDLKIAICFSLMILFKDKASRLDSVIELIRPDLGKLSKQNSLSAVMDQVACIGSLDQRVLAWLLANRCALIPAQADGIWGLYLLQAASSMVDNFVLVEEAISYQEKRFSPQQLVVIYTMIISLKAQDPQLRASIIEESIQMLSVDSGIGDVMLAVSIGAFVREQKIKSANVHTNVVVRDVLIRTFKQINKEFQVLISYLIAVLGGLKLSSTDVIDLASILSLEIEKFKQTPTKEAFFESLIRSLQAETDLALVSHESRNNALSLARKFLSWHLLLGLEINHPLIMLAADSILWLDLDRPGYPDNEYYVYAHQIALLQSGSISDAIYPAKVLIANPGWKVEIQLQLEGLLQGLALIQNQKTYRQLKKEIGEINARLPAESVQLDSHTFTRLLGNFERRLCANFKGVPQGQSWLEAIQTMKVFLTGTSSFTAQLMVLPLGKAMDEKVPDLVQKLYEIASYIVCLDNTYKDPRTGLSLQEEEMMSLFLMIEECSVGQEAGIRIGHGVVQGKMQGMQVRSSELALESEIYVQRYLAQMVQKVLAEVVESPDLLMKLQVRGMQGVHQAKYIRNLLGKGCGMDCTIEMDPYAGVISRDLMQRTRQEILQEFFRLVTKNILRIIKRDLNAQLFQAEGKGTPLYNHLVDFFTKKGFESSCIWSLDEQGGVELLEPSLIVLLQLGGYLKENAIFRHEVLQSSLKTIKQRLEAPLEQNLERVQEQVQALDKQVYKAKRLQSQAEEGLLQRQLDAEKQKRDCLRQELVQKQSLIREKEKIERELASAAAFLQQDFEEIALPVSPCKIRMVQTQGLPKDILACEERMLLKEQELKNAQVLCEGYKDKDNKQLAAEQQEKIERLQRSVDELCEQYARAIAAYQEFKMPSQV